MRTLSIFIVLILFSRNAYNQEDIYYYGNDFGIIENKSNAAYKREIIQRNATKKVVMTYQMDKNEWVKIKKELVRQLSDTQLQIKQEGDKIWKEKIIRSYSPTENGLYYFIDHLDENVILEGTATSIIPLHKQDTVKSYYQNNAPKSIAVYDNNKLLSNQNWLKNGTKYFSDIHFFVDNLPEYSNGPVHFRAYIMNGLKEAEIDLNQITGKVLINWVVMENGELTGFNSVSGVYNSLSNILIKLIKEMPGEWTPAKVNGKPVRYYMNMPFNFIDRSENFDQVELSNGFVVWD